MVWGGGHDVSGGMSMMIRVSFLKLNQIQKKIVFIFKMNGKCFKIKLKII